MVFIGGRYELLVGAMGLSIFVMMATFFEPAETALRWGGVSVVLFEAALLARSLVPSLDLGFRIGVAGLYIVPPVILIFFSLFGRIMNQHLTKTLRESEMMRLDLTRSYAEIEQRVEARTHDLVEERNRLDMALRELALARDRAEAASRAKSTFLANMSHELRTPLTTILGYSELIEQEARLQGHMQIVSDLDRISTAGQHLFNLISDVLDLAEIEIGKMECRPAPCDIAALLDDVVDAIRPLARRNMNTLHVRNSSSPGERHLDCAKVRQILANLLTNATTFTKRGAITLTVADDQIDEVDWITFTVADTGTGITPELREQLFHPFVRGDIAGAYRDGGTGLGLAICQRFCHLMGGEIAVASELGHGSTFTVRIPTSAVPCPTAPVPADGIGSA